MKVREAWAVASRWVAAHAGAIPGFAGAFLSGSAIWLPAEEELADPSGRLARLRSEVAEEWAARRWVGRRCQDAERRILDGLARLDPAQPSHDQATT